MIRTLTLPFLLFLAFNLTAQTTITGHLDNMDGWADTIYLRAITDYANLFASTNGYLTATAGIDTEGNFNFTLDSLPCTDCLYRLNLPVKGGSTTAVFTDNSKENFALFDLRPEQQLSVAGEADQLLKTFRVTKGGPTWNFSEIREVRTPIYEVTDKVALLFSDPANLVGKDMDSLRLAVMSSAEKVFKKTNVDLLQFMQSSDNVYDKVVGLKKYDYDMSLNDDRVVYKQTLADLERLAPNHAYTKQLRIVMDADAKNLQVGSKVPDIFLPDTAGINQAVFAASEGLILLDFWASWCGPCRLENRTTVVPLYAKLAAKGFNVCSVSIDKKREPWLTAIKTDEMVWTNLLDTEDKKSSAATQFAVVSIPSTFLIDAKTKIIVARNLRGEELKRFVEEYLAR